MKILCGSGSLRLHSEGEGACGQFGGKTSLRVVPAAESSSCLDVSCSSSLPSPGSSPPGLWS